MGNLIFLLPLMFMFVLVSCGSKLKYELQKEYTRTFADTPPVEITPNTNTNTNSNTNSPTSEVNGVNEIKEFCQARKDNINNSIVNNSIVKITKNNFVFTQKFIDSEGVERVITNKDDGKPVVMIFAGDWCEPCKREIPKIVNALKCPDLDPNKIHLLTLMVGSIAEDAKAFKESFKMPWVVGIDEDASIISKYCPQQTTPCIIVHTAERGVVLRHIGEYPVENLKTLTGEWEGLE
ncbi:MAG: redoxin domain-containing protein [Oligoflexia bacterium]|nr:redoxin domain-containing protein [Oligoflexia bacterium]